MRSQRNGFAPWLLFSLEYGSAPVGGRGLDSQRTVISLF